MCILGILLPSVVVGGGPNHQFAVTGGPKLYNLDYHINVGLRLVIELNRFETVNLDFLLSSPGGGIFFGYHDVHF